MRAKPALKLVVTSVAKMRRLNALFKPGFITQNFQWIFATVSRFWEFRAKQLKSRLQLDHVPVHRTHSVKVTKMLTTSLSTGLARIVRLGEQKSLTVSCVFVVSSINFSCREENGNTLCQRKTDALTPPGECRDVPSDQRSSRAPKQTRLCASDVLSFVFLRGRAWEEGK